MRVWCNVVLLACLLCSGCGGHRAESKPLQDPQSKSVVTQELIKADTVVAQDKIIQGLKGDLKVAEAHRVVLVDESRASKLYWSAGILGFLGVALGFAAWFLPIGRAKLIGAAVISESLAGLCWYLGDHVHYLPLIAGAVVAVGVTGVVIADHLDVLKTLVTEWKTYAASVSLLNPNERTRLDANSIIAQTETGVKTLVDRVL